MVFVYFLYLTDTYLQWKNSRDSLGMDKKASRNIIIFISL